MLTQWTFLPLAQTTTGEWCFCRELCTMQTVVNLRIANRPNMHHLTSPLTPSSTASTKQSASTRCIQTSPSSRQPVSSSGSHGLRKGLLSVSSPESTLLSRVLMSRKVIRNPNVPVTHSSTYKSQCLRRSRGRESERLSSRSPASMSTPC